MKKMYLFYWIIVFIIAFIKTEAQQCATVAPAKPFFISPERIKMVQAASDYLYVLKIYVHILRNNDGSNPATTPAQLNSDLVMMGSFFRPHNICFALVGVDYVDNTTLNTQMNFDDNSHKTTLLGYNRHTDVIDIYVHSGSVKYGGSSYAIPNTAYSVVQSANFNFYHEMGHALGLLHTFETAYGVACPDNSNCSTTGDLICDTNADYAGSQNDRSGCTYTGNNTIFCNGANRAYNPPKTNIMGYWASCYAQFTTNQATVMRNTISLPANQGGLFQNYLAPNNNSLSGNFGYPVNYSGELRVAAKNEIEIGNLAYPFNGNVTLMGNHNSIINAGNRIRILPGTRLSPSSGKITLMLNNICF